MIHFSGSRRGTDEIRRHRRNRSNRDPPTACTSSSIWRAPRLCSASPSLRGLEDPLELIFQNWLHSIYYHCEVILQGKGSVSRTLNRSGSFLIGKLYASTVLCCTLKFLSSSVITITWWSCCAYILSASSWSYIIIFIIECLTSASCISYYVIKIFNYYY